MKKALTKKISKPIMPPSRRSKSSPHSKSRFYELKDVFSWKEYDPGPEWGVEIGEKLFAFVVENEDILSFNDFYDWLGIPETTYKRLRRKYKKLQQAHDWAKNVFAGRREKGATLRVYELRMIIPTLRLYHSDWKKIHEENIELRKLLAPKDTNDTPTHLTVVMPDV